MPSNEIQFQVEDGLLSRDKYKEATVYLDNPGVLKQVFPQMWETEKVCED